MATALKSADLVFFLAHVTTRIKGISRVRKINKTRFWIQCDTWWSIYALNQTFYSFPYSSRKVLKECLLCVVQLCRVHPRTSDQFVCIVGGLLLTSSQETVLLLCETLASFASMKRGVLKLLLPDLCNCIGKSEFCIKLTYTAKAVVPLGFSIDGFEIFFERSKFPNFSHKTSNFYVFLLNFPKN